MINIEREKILDLLRKLEKDEWQECLGRIYEWAEGMCIANPEDSTPVPAKIKTEIERQLKSP